MKKPKLVVEAWALLDKAGNIHGKHFWKPSIFMNKSNAHDYAVGRRSLKVVRVEIHLPERKVK